MTKGLLQAVRPLVDNPFQAFASSLLGTMPWRVVLALILTVLRTVAQGAQLLLLVPLMQLVGLDVEQGAVGWLARVVVSLFEFAGIPATLASVLVAFVLFTIALALLTRWQMTFNAQLGESFMAILRQRLYRATLGANWLAFSKKRSSDFTHALTIELERVGRAAETLLLLVTDIMLLCAYGVLALRLSPIMTGMVVVAGLLLLLLLRRKTSQARWTGEEISSATNRLYSAVTEHLDGMKIAKSYNAEERSTRIFSGLSNRVAQANVNAARNYAETSFWFTVGSAVILGVILYVSFEFLAIPSAGVLLLLFLFNRMIPLFSNAQFAYQQLLNGLPAFAGVMRLQAYCEAAAEPPPESSRKIELAREIRFENVSFAYDGEDSPAAIRDLNMTVRAGETTAIVGPSGAGKSTLADLVIGLVVPTRGRVLVDGEPLAPELAKSWRGRIGSVAQDTVLFNDTVKANLLWASPDATDDEIVDALKLVAGGFVFALPEGLETVLGDRGVRLSGGERQRLALARALLRRPSLLILDEATSALDSENEGRIRRAIEKLHGRTTILMIAHRLSTVREADVIHVLEGGRLVESGSWQELARTEGGRFNALVQAQDIE